MLTKEQQEAINSFIDDVKTCKTKGDVTRLGLQLARSKMQRWMVEKCWPMLQFEVNKFKKKRPKKRFVAVDFSLWAHQSFQVAKGKPRCVPDFVYRIQKLREKGEIVIMTKDSKSSFRKEILPSYKSEREHPPELYHYMQEMANELWDIGVMSIELEGFESDDVMASLATTVSIWGDHLVLETVDRDMWQCLSAYCTMANKGEEFTQKDLKEKHRIRPDQSVDWMCMVGKNDVKGVHQIGPKTASDLLEQYDTLANIIDNREDLPRFTEALAEFRASGMEYKTRRVHTLWATQEIDFETIDELT